jgi:hypothetical protein
MRIQEVQKHTVVRIQIRLRIQEAHPTDLDPDLEHKIKNGLVAHLVWMVDDENSSPPGRGHRFDYPRPCKATQRIQGL